MNFRLLSLYLDGLHLHHHHRAAGPASESGTESLASLASYSSSCYQAAGPPGRRHSLSRLVEDTAGGSRLNLAARRSARLPAHREAAVPLKGGCASGCVYISKSIFVPEWRTSFCCAVPFVQYRPVQWFLKPLFFEVPQRSGQPLFIGRQWLYREIYDMLTSDLPTNRCVSANFCVAQKFYS
jgi:hypothetical protein